MATRRLTWGAGACLVAFVLLTVLVLAVPASSWPMQSVADSLFSTALSSASLVDAARLLSALGSDLVAAVVVVIACAGFLVTRHRALAAYLAASAVISTIVVSVVKALVDESRPPTLGVLADATSASYPSGHAAGGIAVFGALGATIALAWPSRLCRLVGALVFVVGVAIGISRLVLGVHWAVDVLGGWLLGLAVTLGAGAAVLARVRRAQPGEPGEWPLPQ